MLEVDGRAVAEQGLGCAPPYTRVVPCRPSASGTLGWDTRSVPNGSHQVRLVVFDATGTNQAAAGPFAVRVRNRGALACTPSGIGIRAGWSGRRAGPSASAAARGSRAGVVGAAAGRPRDAVRRRDRPAAAERRHARRRALPAAGPRHPQPLLRVGVQADPATLACSRPLSLRVRAGLSLTVRPRALRNGERVRLRGRVRGGAIPPKGKLVELQAREGGDWRTFASLRSDRRGRFATRYRFQRTFSPRTYRFRARARAEARFPFVLGVSRSVPVRVTP